MTFNQVIQTGPDEEGGDDKAVTAMGILNTIDTLLSVVEDHKEVSSKAPKHTAHTQSRLITHLRATSSAQADGVGCSFPANTAFSRPPTPGNTLCSHRVQSDSEAEKAARNSARALCHHVCWNMGAIRFE